MTGKAGWLVAMNEGPANDDCANTPFDDFSKDRAPGAKRELHLAAIAKTLRVLSALALIFAAVTAVAIIVLDALHGFQPGISWRVKSALPLIGIGVSYALLLFTLPRTLTEFSLGLVVSLGFILWGAEQFMHMAWIISMVDDCVVFLFVLDLGIVIRGHLRQKIDRS